VTLFTVLSTPLWGAETPSALLAPYSNAKTPLSTIPDGYFEAVTLESQSLFKMQDNVSLDIVLPRLGRLSAVHDRTRTVDINGKVTRWEGHVKDHSTLKISFVESISGMVSGIIDTPTGRLLLGQAGDYIVYKQSTSLPPANSNALNGTPEALLKPANPDKNAAPLTKPTTASYPIEFNAAALAKIPLNSEVKLTLPGNGEYRIVHDATLTGSLGASTFVGYLKDFGDDFRMIVTYSPTSAQGRILTPYGLYLIKTIGHQQWLIDTTRSGLQSAKPETPDSIAGDINQLSVPADDAPLPNESTHTDSSSQETSPDKTQIDVLILYTPGLEDAYEGPDQVLTHIQNLVALANQAYIDSDIAVTLNLVGALKIDAAEDTPNRDTLHAITDGTPPFDNVAWLRDAYGADLVSLIRPFSMKQGGGCGSAWVGGTNQTSIALYKSLGYSVVGDGRDGNRYCSDYSLAHELGHNMGTTHDRATVAEQNGSLGAFPYSFGYGIEGEFGTVMSYIDPRIGKFSNPDKRCASSNPCGIPVSDSDNSADNALAINNGRRYIAAYSSRTTNLEKPLSITGKITADSTALKGATITGSSSATCSITDSNGNYVCLAPKDWTGTITPVLSGYGFSPASISIDQLNDSTVDQDFVATQGANSREIAESASQSGGGGGGTIDIEAIAALLLLSLLRASTRRQ